MMLARSSLALGACALSLLALYRQFAPNLRHNTTLSSGAFLVVMGTVSWLALFLARNYVFVPTQFLPAILVAKFVQREQMLVQFRDVLEAHNEGQPVPHVAERVSIPVESGVVLDGMEIRSANKRARWVVWFNANGVIYEQILDFLDIYSREVDANVIVFNYRGVGASTGWPTTAMDLTNDGIAVVKHIMQKGVAEHDILLHGHSIGGAVMAHVAVAFPSIKAVSDRSFSSLVDECVVMMHTPLRTVLGIFLGVASSTILATVSSVAGDNVPPAIQATSSFLRTVPVGAFLGWLAAKYGFMATLAPIVIRMFDWEMDAASQWTAQNRLILYHKRDGMIPYGVSLHKIASESGLANPNSFELTARGDPQFNHMHPLTADQHTWPLVAALIRKLHRS